MVNQHLQFTAEICTKDTNIPPSDKKYKVQIVKNNEFPFLVMKIGWYPEGGMQLGLFINEVHQLKYFGKGITHTPSTLQAIPSGVLNRLVKLTSRKPNFNSKRVDNVYPNHDNALRKAGLTPPIFPKMV